MIPSQTSLAMPSIAQAPLSPLNGRKRRRNDGVQVKISSNPHMRHHHHNNISPYEPAAPLNEDSPIPIPQPSERKYISLKRSSLHDSKRQRTACVFPDLYPAAPPPNTTTIFPTEYQTPRHSLQEPHVKKPIDLSPCHICRRKPTVKSELDAFASCEGCVRRTCYVCIRECLGSAAAAAAAVADVEMGEYGEGEEGHEEITKAEGGWDLADRRTMGHRGMVCSRCCVERGTEGEVWCLGCLRAEEG